MSFRDEKENPNVYGKQIRRLPSGGERLKEALRAIRRAAPNHPDPGKPELLSHEWARDIDTKVASHERQLKILNATMLTALIADILTRLLKP